MHSMRGGEKYGNACGELRQMENKYNRLVQIFSIYLGAENGENHNIINELYRDGCQSQNNDRLYYY